MKSWYKHCTNWEAAAEHNVVKENVGNPITYSIGKSRQYFKSLVPDNRKT